MSNIIEDINIIEKDLIKFKKGYNFRALRKGHKQPENELQSILNKLGDLKSKIINSEPEGDSLKNENRNKDNIWINDESIKNDFNDIVDADDILVDMPQNNTPHNDKLSNNVNKTSSVAIEKHTVSNKNTIITENINPIKRYSYAPNDDGSFSNNKRDIKDAPDRDTVFEFTLLDGNKAELRIIDNPKIHQKAINNYQTYLKKIAIKKGNSNQLARKIIIDEPGLFELKNNKWVLINKLEITLV